MATHSQISRAPSMFFCNRLLAFAPLVDQIERDFQAGRLTPMERIAALVRARDETGVTDTKPSLITVGSSDLANTNEATYRQRRQIGNARRQRNRQPKNASPLSANVG